MLILKISRLTLSKTCPISLNRIDAHFVRVIAIEVIILALILIFTQKIIFAFILLFDFSVRTLKFKQLSPLAYIAKNIIKYFNIKPLLCDEAPKRFALYVGVSIILLFTLCYLFNFNMFASVLVFILLFCAFLEATFDYCVGCKVYHSVQYLRKRS